MSLEKVNILHPDSEKDKEFKNTIDKVIETGAIGILDTAEMSSEERSVVHEYCEKLNLYTKSDKVGLSKIMKVSKHKFPIEITNMHVYYFVKQMHLPISYCTVDTIKYYLSLLNPYYNNCLENYEIYCDEFKNGFDPLQETNAVSKKAINFIKTHEEYIKLIKNTPKLDLGQRKKLELYQMIHIGKRFVSLDVKKGNFTVLKLRCPGIFDGTWEDFISKYTDSKFIRNTKRIREVIFGDLNFSKLANSLQEHEINELYQYLSHSVIFKNMTLISKVGDEMIFSLHDNLKNEDLLETMKEYNKQIFHVKIFTLKQFDGVPYYYKMYTDGTIEPRKVNKKYMMQVIKHYEGKPIEELDLTCVDDERIPYVYKKSIFD